MVTLTEKLEIAADSGCNYDDMARGARVALEMALDKPARCCAVDQHRRPDHLDAHDVRALRDSLTVGKDV